MTSEADERKRVLRAQLREARRLLTPAARAHAAEGVARQLDALVAAHRATTITCFASTATEPGTHLFLRGAVHRGIRVLLPISDDDGRLDWALADGDAREGRFGILEPTGERLGPAALTAAELMIIPAAAIARDGTRLGWGRGYFDRALGPLTECPPVYGVIYDSEVLDSLPRESHDRPVNGIVTPTRTIVLRPTRH